MTATTFLDVERRSDGGTKSVFTFPREHVDPKKAEERACVRGPPTLHLLVHVSHPVRKGHSLPEYMRAHLAVLDERCKRGEWPHIFLKNAVNNCHEW